MYCKTSVICSRNSNSKKPLDFQEKNCIIKTGTELVYFCEHLDSEYSALNDNSIIHCRTLSHTCSRIKLFQFYNTNLCLTGIARHTVQWFSAHVQLLHSTQTTNKSFYFFINYVWLTFNFWLLFVAIFCFIHFPTCVLYLCIYCAFSVDLFDVFIFYKITYFTSAEDDLCFISALY